MRWWGRGDGRSISRSREIERERDLRKARQEAEDAIAAYNRLVAKGEQTYYSPVTPRDGTVHVPPAIWRKYESLRHAMRERDVIRVHELQVQLRSAGYEMPTCEAECDEALERLRADEQRRAAGYAVTSTD